jgi:hypothetical protein
MPYVVTTKRPCPACTHGPAGGGEHRPESVSRRAVATLEEAHCVAYDIAEPGPRGERHNHQAALLLPESGGTVGPLPGGTVIEVKPVEWYWLYDKSGYGRTSQAA